MQISGSLSLSNIASELGLSKPSSKPNAQPNAGQDQVQISGLASQLASDPSKLSQLQAAYENGTYSVSPSQIANTLLDSMLQS